MFVLFWTSLFLCVHGTGQIPETCPVKFKHCQSGSYCQTLIEGEIRAEAGLCVVIPCSFTTNAEFNVTGIIWYKCATQDAQERCNERNAVKPVFNSNNTASVEPEFRGRVSMLEPNLSLRNCSITVKDLKTSDSGSYQLRIIGHIKDQGDAFTFLSKAKLSVKGLSQKPTVMVPPLTAGQQNTLTCTAPGLCSGSVPEFTWTWRKTGENNSYITGNITDTKTENVSDVTRRHSSTLTFNLSADHHNTEVTCKVNFGHNKSTQETVTLNVNYVPCCTEDAKQNITSEQTNSTQSLPVHHDGPPASVFWSVTGASLIVNALFMISFIYLWISKTKVKPNQVTKSDMSTQETDSDVYENVPKRLN